MAPVEQLASLDAVAAAVLVVCASGFVRIGHLGARRARLAARVGPGDRWVTAEIATRPSSGIDWRVVLVVATGAFVVVGFGTASLLRGVGAAIASIALTYGSAVASRRRAAARMERELPGVVEELARSLRSGASFHQALLDVAATTPGALGMELSVVTGKAALGTGLDHALRDWGRDHELANVRLFCGAMTLTMRSGADSGTALDGLAQSMRDKASVEQETKALVAQAQLSGLVIAALPVVFLVLSLAVDRGGASFLLTTPAGRACLIVALGLDTIGYGWMRHLARSVGT